MLIFLHESLTSDLNLLKDEAVWQFDDILLLHSKFLHYVAATKKTALLILRGLDGRLSSRSKETLNLISSQSSDSTVLLHKSCLYVEIRKRDLAGLTIESDESLTKWVCDLSCAVKWLSQQSKIIGEHLTDVGAFCAAGKHYAVINNFNPRMQTSVAELTGGSGNAPLVLKKRISDGFAPVLCVIDSDKYSPLSGGSASISKCQEIVDKNKGIFRFHPLIERELENIVPLDFLRQGVLRLNLSKDRDSILNRVDILTSVNNESSDIYRYVDVKFGTCKSWIVSKGVEKFYEKEPIRYSCHCRADCEGFISPPLFEDVLFETVEYFENSSDKIYRELSIDKVGQSWINLGLVVFYMALSNNIRTT